ncbi:hypothetical protein VTN77DRAFT_9227 [Rasamsonia byssochlamydoides]|uniref:uncharacterized protein n=1 Tax=Rasamsonia byssochlamydoides TaxID=89139 RepID=UPI0037446539
MTGQEKIHMTATLVLAMSIFGVDLSRSIKLLNCRLGHDFTLCALPDVILTATEMAIGIIISCVPTLGRIFCSDSSQNGPLYETERSSRSGSCSKLDIRPYPLRQSSSTTTSNISPTTTTRKEEDSSYIRPAATAAAGRHRRRGRRSIKNLWESRHHLRRPKKAHLHIHKRHISGPMPLRPNLLELHKSFDASLYRQLDEMDYHYRIRSIQPWQQEEGEVDVDRYHIDS